MYKVVYYARVSTEEEGQLNAIENQIQMLEDFINKQSEWQLVDNYIDRGKSGTTTKGRNEYNRLCKDLKTDKFDIIIVKDLSRLQRNPLDYYKFIDSLVKNQKKLYIYVDNKFYESDDALINGIKAILASEYSRDISKKVNAGQRQRQKVGIPITNGTTWGFNQERGSKKLIINEEEAKIVRQIFDWYCEGKGFRTIQQLLSKQGIINHNGNDFALTTLKRMIRNEKYKGTLVSNKRHKDFDTKKVYDNPESEWIIHENAIPSIISTEIWEKANAILNKKKKAYNIDDKQVIAGYFNGSYNYSGKIICGKCGKSYWHQKYKTMKHDMWQCSTYRQKGKDYCNNDYIYTYVLDELVKKTIFMYMQQAPETIDNLINMLNMTLENNDNSKDIKKLSKDIEKLNNRKDKLIDMLADELISKTEYIKKKQDIDNQLEDLNLQYEQIKNKNSNILSKQERLFAIKKKLNTQFNDWHEITDEYIEEMLDKVIVKDNNNVEITLHGDITYIADKNTKEVMCAGVTDSR